MRLASNYSKLIEINDIGIKFWFEYLRIPLKIQIETFFDSNSDIQLKIEKFQLFNQNYLRRISKFTLDCSQNRSIINHFSNSFD